MKKRSTKSCFSHYGVFALLLALLLSACGGGGSQARQSTTPDAPANIAVNIGDSALSLGWSPPVNDGGSAISDYSIEVTPPIPAGDILQSGTHALLRNLSNGTNYQVRVRASNSLGTGPWSAAFSAQPQAVVSANYRVLSISGDNSPSGVYDPSVLKGSNGTLWLAYSSVDYHRDGNNNLVQDVGIRIARSTDGGVSFSQVAVVATPTTATVTGPLVTEICGAGATSCSGRWSHEVSWLIEDPGDPDPARRFKLFAHKYFLYPPGATNGGNRTIYPLGAIAMWTAAAPDGVWSAEIPLLGWPLTPPELSPVIQDVTLLHSDLVSCMLVSEGSARVNNGLIDFAFACPYDDVGTITQKIVLLRSRDHAASFEYVGTPLSPADAPPGVDYFSAPSLIASPDPAPVLLATPVVSGLYAGSIAFPVTDEVTGSLFHVGGLAAGMLYAPVAATGHVGGASSYDPALGSRGILQSDAILAADPVDTQFRIISTGALRRN